MKRFIFILFTCLLVCSCSSDKFEEEFDPTNYEGYNVAESHMLTSTESPIIVRKSDTERIIHFYTFDSYKVTTNCDWIIIENGEKEINREVKYYIEEDGSKSYYLDNSNSSQSVTIKLVYNDVGEANYINLNEYIGLYNSPEEFFINKIGYITIKSWDYSMMISVIQLAQ